MKPANATILNSSSSMTTPGIAKFLSRICVNRSHLLRLTDGFQTAPGSRRTTASSHCRS